MHKNIPFFSVRFEYKEAYLKNFIEKKYNIPYKELKNALQYTNTYDRIPEAEIIANQVLSYKGNAPEGYMFFDAKVEEVMSSRCNVSFMTDRVSSQTKPERNLVKLPSGSLGYMVYIF